MPIEYYAAVDGYYEKSKEKAELLRFASFRVAECMVGTKALGSIEKFWPMGEVEEKRPMQKMTKEQYDNIINRSKHGRRVKNTGIA